jgi:phosphate-selective porin OprO/OprP
LLVICLFPGALCARELASGDRTDFSSKDDRLRLELSGRLHLDAAYFDADNTPLEDTVRVRRARLGVALTLFRDFTVKYQYDFTGDGRTLDASLSYEGFDPWEVKIGQFREPFSLEELTSSNNNTFMERALPNEFARGYNTGIAISTHGADWSAAGGVFGDRVVKNVFGAGDEDLALTGRVTYAPVHNDEGVAHFGINASRRDVEEGGRVRFATNPESPLADENLVSTGSIQDADVFYVAGLEAAGVRGPFSIQGEYIHTALDRDNGRSDLNFSGLNFSGGYAYVSWFLTGESRPYNVKRGYFSGIKPNRATGAFELALRFSALDLNDGGVTGGREMNTTLGLNWYYRRNLRLMTNLIHVDTDDEGGNEDVNIVQFRAQLHF